MRIPLWPLVAFLVVIAGCASGAGEDTIEGAFVGGTAGLKMEFIENAPPREVFDGGTFPFEILVIVENVGETKIPVGGLRLTLSGIFEDDFGVSKENLKTVNERLLEPVSKDPDGHVLRGYLDQIGFPVPKPDNPANQLNFVGTVTESQTFPFRVDACYNYKTVAVSSMCIHEDLLKRDSDVCRLSGSKKVSNSGGPVHVTSVTESVSGVNSIILNFEVKKVGSGQIYTRENGPTCPTDFNKRDRVRVRVSTGIDTEPKKIEDDDSLNANLKCVGLLQTKTPAEWRTGELILRNGKGSFSCIQTFTADTQLDAVKGIVVELSYQTKDSITTNIVVKHTLRPRPVIEVETNLGGTQCNAVSTTCCVSPTGQLFCVGGLQCVEGLCVSDSTGIRDDPEDTDNNGADGNTQCSEVGNDCCTDPNDEVLPGHCTSNSLTCVNDKCVLKSIEQELGLAPNVFIIEDDGTFDASVASAVTTKFYEKYSDDYDFIGIHHKNGNPASTGAANFLLVGYTAFEGNFAAIESVRGVRDYGSMGRLLGVYEQTYSFGNTFIDRGPNNGPLNIIDDVYFELIMHELTHAWGVTLPNELKDALSSTGFFGDTHWPVGVGSWVSHGGPRSKFVEKDGKYYYIEACSEEPKHHDFMLYSMGLKSAEEINDKLVIVKPDVEFFQGITRGVVCDVPIERSEDFVRNTFTIQDFIDVLGPRRPSVAEARKDFTIAFVMVVPKGETLSQKEIDALNWIANKLPVVWYKSTEKRSTFNGIIPQDITPPTISNVEASATESSITVTWTTNEPSIPYVIYTEPITEYAPQDVIFPNIITNPPQFSMSHEIIIELNDFSPIDPNKEYSIKILSIDENYNMGSFDAGKIVTKSS